MTTDILPSDGMQGLLGIQAEHRRNNILGHDVLFERGESTLTVRMSDPVRQLDKFKLAANNVRSFRMPGDAFHCQCLKVVA